METYDPLNPPDMDAWQSLDEGERISLVTDHHRKAGVKLPSPQVHAVLHVVVENQIAMGEEIPVEATVRRLIREGLDRHEAIHAVGSVLADFMQAVLAGDGAAPFDDEGYTRKLKKLKAAEWLKSLR